MSGKASGGQVVVMKQGGTGRARWGAATLAAAMLAAGGSHALTAASPLAASEPATTFERFWRDVRAWLSAASRDYERHVADPLRRPPPLETPTEAQRLSEDGAAPAGRDARSIPAWPVDAPQTVLQPRPAREKPVTTLAFGDYVGRPAASLSPPPPDAEPDDAARAMAKEAEDFAADALDTARSQIAAEQRETRPKPDRERRVASRPHAKRLRVAGGFRAPKREAGRIARRGKQAEAVRRAFRARPAVKGAKAVVKATGRRSATSRQLSKRAATIRKLKRHRAKHLRRCARWKRLRRARL